MGILWSQFFPPAPTLTEANLPNQSGKVFIVTGGYSGVGLELCKILYRANAKVYLAGRSESKALAAIETIKTTCSSSTPSTGDIIFLPINLADLTTIKPAVQTFLASESRLDVLFNNAGVSNPPAGSISPQGHELQLATNCLGPHLLTQLLLPTLRATARNQPPASVRVIWLASIVVDTSAPANGVNLDELLRPSGTPLNRNYENTKVGNWFLAHDLAKQAGAGAGAGAGDDAILSLVVNPGNLRTNLTRHLPSWVPWLVAPLLYPPIIGAYSELWAGFSSELGLQDGGKYVLPWGRLHPRPRGDLVRAMKGREEGGTGEAGVFLRYCYDQIKEFM